MGRHLTPLAWSSLRGRHRPSADWARAIRASFDDLGATYVKFGQLIASAPGLFGADFAQRFRDLLDAGPSVPFEDVRRIVERELGAPLEQLFGEFDRSPIAAASLAVVHRAVLADGRAVAVKVLRPDVDALVDADLAWMESVSRVLARMGVLNALPLLQFVVGLRAQLAEELDLTREAETMERFRRFFADQGFSRLVVPGLHRSLSARRVLTMDLLDGRPVDDAAAAELSGKAPELLEEMGRALIASAFIERAFHGDIHAGNVMLLADGRLGLVDWGIVGRIDDKTHDLYRLLVEAALGNTEAWSGVARGFTDVAGPGLKEANGLTDEQIERLVRAVVEPVVTAPMAQLDLRTLFHDVDETNALAGVAQTASPLARRWKSWRTAVRFARIELDRGVQASEFDRAHFLFLKQLLYSEGYGKTYLPDQSLLGDHDFLRKLLDDIRVT